MKGIDETATEIEPDRVVGGFNSLVARFVEDAA